MMNITLYFPLFIICNVCNTSIVNVYTLFYFYYIIITNSELHYILISK